MVDMYWFMLAYAPKMLDMLDVLDSQYRHMPLKVDTVDMLDSQYWLKSRPWREHHLEHVELGLEPALPCPQSHAVSRWSRT